MTKLRYTPEQIRAESQWTPHPPKRCPDCGERLKVCVCVVPYVGKKREPDWNPNETWMR